MSRYKAPVAVSILILLGIAIAPASQAAPNKIVSGLGHDLAQGVCTSCHLIESGQVNPTGHVGGPTFQSVADRPGMTRAALRHHLQTTHTNAMIPLAMPNPELTEDELNKIITYILSLHEKQ
jgi:mono/diheme cytochrome c family protein